MIHHAFLHNVMQKTSPAQSLHTVLLRTLDDRMADYIAVSQALDALGWHSRHTYCCLYLQLSDIGSEKPDGKLGLRLSGKYSDRLLRVSARRRYRCIL